MGIFTKNNEPKEPPEPQYYLSATNMPTYNYKVYYMSKFEKLITFLVGFAVGAAVGYLFYGGIGKDEFGEPTKMTYILNIVISSIAGFAAGWFFVPMRTKSIQKKRQKRLKSQFRDMLEALTTSLGAGKNIQDSFTAVYSDLKAQYEDDSDILRELEVILAGINNNVDIEDILEDFGARSGVDDIVGFANVFRVCYRRGGNIKDTIRSTHEILSDKMNIAEDIETVVTSSKNEQNIMMVMPIILIALIKFSSEDFAANFATPTGIGSTTVALGLFVAAYFIGKEVLDIKI